MMLDKLLPGSECRVKKLTNSGKLDQRLMDLGLYPGVNVRVVRNAPLEDPMELELDGCFVSMRHAEAEFVEVELVEVKH